MSTAEERHEIGRQLEQRHLVPDKAEQAAIRREAEQVARRVTLRRRMSGAQAVITLLEDRGELGDG
jgi:hypothetical protein